MNFLEQLKKDYLDSKKLTLAEVKALCPTCAEKMEANGMTHLDISGMEEEIVAAKKKKAWKKGGKGWEMPGSLKKYLASLTGDAKHKTTKCVEKLKDVKDIDDKWAFCASALRRLGERK